MPSGDKINCAQTPNAPICQIYPLLFRQSSHLNSVVHNDKEESSDHIIQVLFSAHSAEAAIYVLIVLLIYAIIFVVLLHSSIGEKEECSSNSDFSKQSLLQLSEAQMTVQQHGTTSQLINLGNGSKKLCTRPATQIVQETDSKSKAKCEPVRPGIAKAAFNEDDEELILSDQPEQIACFV